MGCTVCIGCGDCGMKRTLPTVMRCPMCGEDVDIYVRVCEACGFTFVPPGTNTSDAKDGQGLLK